MSERMYYSKEAEKRAQTERGFIALLFLGLGLSVGAAIALIFAPMRGDELRDELNQQVGKARDSIEDYGDKAHKAILN